MRILLICLIALVGLSGPVWAFNLQDEVLANVIFQVEGVQSKHPYGIKNIDTGGDVVEARRICLNTIRNHYRRHAWHDCGLDFIACLGARYCPPQAHRLNKHWVPNVRRLLP